MRQTKCPICKSIRHVLGYSRDNPVLSCGHVLDIDQQIKRDEIKDILQQAITCSVYQIMREKRVSYTKAKELYILE
jgi:hypothetical protein